MRELYPSKEALDVAGTGVAGAMVETFAQLDELLVTVGASVGRIVDNCISVDVFGVVHCSRRGGVAEWVFCFGKS
jgi:hypothetical protein